MSTPTFTAILRALELRGARLYVGPGKRGPAYAFGGADGELRHEAWSTCPACSEYGLRVDRRDDGRARVSCRTGCRPQEILGALASAVSARVAA